MRVVDLREELHALGLASTGTKAVLQERLLDYREDAAIRARWGSEGLPEREKEEEAAASHQPDGVSLGGAVLDPSAPARVLVVLNGLQGAGKTTLCRLLGSVYGGSLWMNQDEIRRGRGAAYEFREGVTEAAKAAAAPGSPPRLLLVDKMNHQQQHRDFVFDVVEKTRWRERGGRVLLVELLPDSGNWDLEHLRSRIEGRGGAHRTLHASDELPEILEKTALSAQALSAEERGRFDAALALDVSMDVADKAVYVAAELFKMGWVNALEWRPRLLGRPVDAAEAPAVEGLPGWVHVLPLSSAPSLPGASVADWEALRSFFELEFQRLQEEERAWTKRAESSRAS